MGEGAETAARDPGAPPDHRAVEARVVLLRDARWPGGSGVCCWRHSVHVAFGELGAPVADVAWQGPAGGADGEVAGAAGDGGAGGDGGDGDRDLAVSLAGAALVVAETIEAAMAAVANGVPRQRVYALALPPEPLQHGARSPFAERLAAAAPAIGGFLTDSELARGSVEQALAGHRPRVEVFPPLAADRACPTCRTVPPLAPEALAARVEAGAKSAVAQLKLWRALLEPAGRGERAELPYSYPVARLLGLGGPWVAARRPGWQPGSLESPMPGLAGDAPEWTAPAQQRAARRIWQAVTPPPGGAARPARVTVVAGYNLKFAVELAERLAARPDLDVVVDEWPAEAEPTELTGKLLDGAESIFAEWLRPSAVWLSQHKRPGQLLAVRLHRYEMDSRYPRDLEIDNVDAVVYIAPMFGRRLRDELGLPAEKLVYIPNFLDVDWFDRPKLPGAHFGLGMVGVESLRKRFDLALDLLAEVRRADPRFTLFVRSVLPWDNQGVWRKREERDYAGWCLERIRRDPLLRGGVVFDPPGRDMARWYRRVGHILSTSDEEGSHMAPAEGMASGAVPVVRPWPGAVEIYDIEWVHGSTGDAAAAVLANADAGAWSERAARAQAEIRRTHDPAAVLQAWADLLHGDVAAAKAHFAEHSDV